MPLDVAISETPLSLSLYFRHSGESGECHHVRGHYKIESGRGADATATVTATAAVGRLANIDDVQDGDNTATQTHYNYYDVMT